MAHFEIEVVIDRPVDVVFPLFNDGSKMPLWMEGFERIEHLGGEPGTVGSQSRLVFRENGREIVLDETMTAVKPNEELAFSVSAPMIASDVTIRFTPEEGRTRVRSTNAVRGTGLFGWAMVPMLAGSIRRRTEGDMRRFKEMVEQL